MFNHSNQNKQPKLNLNNQNKQPSYSIAQPINKHIKLSTTTNPQTSQHFSSNTSIKFQFYFIISAMLHDISANQDDPIGASLRWCINFDETDALQLCLLALPQALWRGNPRSNGIRARQSSSNASSYQPRCPLWPGLEEHRNLSCSMTTRSLFSRNCNLLLPLIFV
jgi:hypothetical protein